LSVGQTLIRRGWRGDGKCCVCGVLESIDHIFFGCVLAKMIWAILKDVFYLAWIPRSLEDFSEDWLQGKGPCHRSLLCSFLQLSPGPFGLPEIRWRLKNAILSRRLMFYMLPYP
jgi:hypothetical protein